MYRFLRYAILGLVRLFYPRIEVQGREHIPAGGPVVYVLNHPNGLMDPLLLMASLRRPVTFLAKSTLFANPLARVCMDAFGALPVFRQMDRGQPGSADDIGARNEQTFALCRSRLARGGALALFPEGTTHSGPTLLPLRTGAARIALGAEDENDWQLGLQIVPVGLWYQGKTLFRTATLLVVGEPWTIGDLRGSYAADQREAVRALTARIDATLDEVVLQVEQADVLAAMPVIAAWTAAAGPPRRLADRHAQAAQLLEAYQRLQAQDPARIEQLADSARRYARTLRFLGIADPWALELPRLNRQRLIWRALLLIFGFPFALAGFVLSYGPYRLAGTITPRLVGYHDTMLGTGKLIVGAVLVLVGWIAAAVVVGLLVSGAAGLGLFVAAPGLAYVALRWGETWRGLREALRYSWLRTRHKTLTAELIERRTALAAQIHAAVREVRGA